MGITINLCITGTTSRLPAQRYASAALSARPFVCRKSLFYRNGWTIELGVFGAEASFHLSDTALLANSGMYKN